MDDESSAACEGCLRRIGTKLGEVEVRVSKQTNSMIVVADSGNDVVAEQAVVVLGSLRKKVEL